MRVMLRDIETGRFFRAPGDWTDDRAQASDFASAWEAITYAREHKLENLEVLLAPGGAPCADGFPEI